MTTQGAMVVPLVMGGLDGSVGDPKPLGPVNPSRFGDHRHVVTAHARRGSDRTGGRRRRRYARGRL